MKINNLFPSGTIHWHSISHLIDHQPAVLGNFYKYHSPLLTSENVQLFDKHIGKNNHPGLKETHRHPPSFPNNQFPISTIFLFLAQMLSPLFHLLPFVPSSYLTPTKCHHYITAKMTTFRDSTIFFTYKVLFLPSISDTQHTRTLIICSYLSIKSVTWNFSIRRKWCVSYWSGFVLILNFLEGYIWWKGCASEVPLSSSWEFRWLRPTYGGGWVCGSDEIIHVLHFKGKVQMLKIYLIPYKIHRNPLLIIYTGREMIYISKWANRASSNCMQ